MADKPDEGPLTLPPPQTLPSEVWGIQNNVVSPPQFRNNSRIRVVNDWRGRPVEFDTVAEAQAYRKNPVLFEFGEIKITRNMVIGIGSLLLVRAIMKKKG